MSIVLTEKKRVPSISLAVRMMDLEPVASGVVQG